VTVAVNYKEWPRVVVTIPDASNPFEVELYFAHAGVNPAFLGFRAIAPDDGIEIGDERDLEPAQFARLARWLPMYIRYARAEIEWKHGDAARALEMLRTEAGKTRRGLSDKFYKDIAAEYEALVQEGDPHPLKSIAAKRPVHKSRASRWVKEARSRGYITDEVTGKNTVNGASRLR